MFRPGGATWIPFAHELGHNLGGKHPFYDLEFTQVGETGGLMDYDHSMWAGARQFGTFNRLRMCPVLEYVFSRTCPGVRTIPTICGDLVVGIGEQCECADKSKSCRY